MKKTLFVLAIILLWTVPVMADRIFIVLPMKNGFPDIGALTFHGFTLVETYKTTGLYQVTGKAAELTALSALAKAQAITKVTDVKPTADVKPVEEVKPGEEVITPKGDTKPAAGTEPVAEAKQWAELDTKIVATEVTKLNALLSAESTSATKPVVDDKMTYREVLKKMVTNKDFERTHWVKDE